MSTLRAMKSSKGAEAQAVQALANRLAKLAKSAERQGRFADAADLLAAAIVCRGLARRALRPLEGQLELPLELA